MKKYFLSAFIFWGLPFLSFSQNKEDSSFLKGTSIPEIKITLPDSSIFTNSGLPKKIPAAIIYFSTECSHCQYEAEEIGKKMDSLSNAFFVWIDYHHSLKEINDFAIKYDLANHTNIKLGKEVDYKTVPYYKIQFTPYMAIYNKEGIFVKEFREGATVTELYNIINK